MSLNNRKEGGRMRGKNGGREAGYLVNQRKDKGDRIK